MLKWLKSLRAAKKRVIRVRLVDRFEEI